MSEQLNVLKVLASRLDAAGVSYMVTGSIAAGIYGQPRMTRDIDIVAELLRPHASKLPGILGPDFDCDAEERDVRAILTIQTTLDWSYLDHWARRLTVASGLARLRA